ncbi:hypothetical protein DRF67_00630 [Chryseobacterium pennipullorum]|uniref:Uncharacterized protein n=2 Tax=Chryseobacterium pennipullorum TaxID=2258963 RepID=A0A3D9B8V1_9FLAO|nr:hypothetical protein DRF67_00630 [Chryseobacterium pennipullorum]
MEMISEKWNIKHKEITGCIVDERLMRTTDRRNKKTFAAIEKKYGADWRIRYEEDILDAAVKQVDIMDVLITNTPFRDQLKKCNIEIDGVEKEVRLLSNSDLYEVFVHAYDQNYRKTGCCTLHVDTKNRKVNIIK